ncbi:MAG: alpha-glucan family phosphorylase [Nitrospirae bacterium]|nr:alpha-glucan family phosphorylase [Nitrospirota bacterium]
MKPVKVFKVIPRIPPKIERLRDLAFNLWWCWDHECIALWRRIDPDLWEDSGHNPVRMLATIRQERLDELADDLGFNAHLERVLASFNRYMTDQKWCERCFGKHAAPVIAYFSLEFGITESLPIYSGGLGILAGDHLKSSSDLGLPLVGVGLLYQKGYFRQYLNYDGWQGERYPENDFHAMPVIEVKTETGCDVVVTVDMPGRTVFAKVWRVDVGFVRLYLLDTNIPVNSAIDQDITDQLYGGDSEMRIKQEIVVGIGGMRALDALGIRPSVCHMNEGHSAFLGLERIRQFMTKDGLSFNEAFELAKASNVFTTHTPVPAGFDVFPTDMVMRYFREYARELGIPMERFLAFGSDASTAADGGFSMAALAMHLSDRFNGVSKLHGHVSRNIFSGMWPGLPVDEVPIGAITNGVHHRSWISNDMDSLYYRYIGDRWYTNPEDLNIWNAVEEIPDEELWRTHERRRERLVAFARKRLRDQLVSRGAPGSEIKKAEEVLDPEILTIGFARRFATYKRADLILRNPERLAAILNNPDMPVQIIFSGKAHPKDTPGKELIRELVRFTEKPEFRKRLVFVEDYDIVIARYLVQGVDVWLNTPRRLYEASGTSGMKAAANGVLNMSILDGWWDEAYQPGIGWAIGKGEEYEDLAYQYDVEANAIYDLLEKEVVPLFYSRGSVRLPRGWISRMKDSLKNLCPVFNTNRMVIDYAKKHYALAERRFSHMSEGGFTVAKALASYRDKLAAAWNRIKIEDVKVAMGSSASINECVSIDVIVYIDGLDPSDIDVQVVEGFITSKGDLAPASANGLIDIHPEPGNRFRFHGEFKCKSSGLRGVSVRIIPKSPLIENPLTGGLVKWAEA